MKLSKVSLVFLGLMFIGRCEAAEPAPTSCPAGYGVDKPAVKIVTAEQLTKVGLNLNEPDNKAIFALCAECLDLEEEGVKSFCSVDSFKKIEYGCGQRPGIAAAINLGGTADPVTIFVLYPVGEKYACQTLDTEHGDIDDVKDLDGDGVPEIVTKEWLMESDCSHANGFAWPEVYSLGSDGFEKKSEKFIQSYYLPSYLERISDRIKNATEMLAQSTSNKESDRTDREQGLAMIGDCREGLNRLVKLVNSSQSKGAATTTPSK